MSQRIVRRVGVPGAAILMALCGAASVFGEDSSGTPRRMASSASLASIRTLAVQHNGRLKPFESFARETLTLITGAPRWHGQDPVLTVLSILADPEPWQATAMIAVPFGPLREALGMDLTRSYISYHDLVSTRKLMRLLPAIVQKQQRDEKLTMLEQETMDAYERFVALSGLFEPHLAVVPPPETTDAREPWLEVFDAHGGPAQRQHAVRSDWTALLDDVRRGDGSALEASARRLSQELRDANPVLYPAPWRLRLEVLYHHAAPFRLARGLYLVAFLLLAWFVASSRPAGWRSGMTLLGAGLALHAGGIAVRVLLGGRPPVSNFYETMLWLPFVGVVLASVFERLYRVGYFGLSAAVLASLVLWLSEHVPLDPSISPVVAVLHSNLWLTIHVLTIVASYGALALAAVLAHVYGWVFLARQSRKRLASLDLFLYRTIQVGVVLLAGGIMLGAVWANASWGRYWGWDPKETWALITLLWFLAVLHGRFAGWLRGAGMALATIAGFLLLLMTYYGVSFYLVGLHSYAGGHAKPLPLVLVGYLALEGLFLALVGAAVWRSRATSRRSTRPSRTHCA